VCVRVTQRVEPVLDGDQHADVRRRAGALDVRPDVRREVPARARYDRLLAERAGEWVRTLPRARNSRSCHHLYVIRTSKRDALRAFLRRSGIETMVHYDKPLHLHPAFRWLGYQRGDFPHAERAAHEVCSLPLHPFLSDKDVDRITAQIARFFARQ